MVFLMLLSLQHPHCKDLPVPRLSFTHVPLATVRRSNVGYPTAPSGLALSPSVMGRLDSQRCCSRLLPWGWLLHQLSPWGPAQPWPTSSGSCPLLRMVNDTAPAQAKLDVGGAECNMDSEAEVLGPVAAAVMVPQGVAARALA